MLQGSTSILATVTIEFCMKEFPRLKCKLQFEWILLEAENHE